MNADSGGRMHFPGFSLEAIDFLIRECVAHLDEVPARGATVFLAPTKVAGATGAPVRIVAYW